MFLSVDLLSHVLIKGSKYQLSQKYQQLDFTNILKNIDENFDKKYQQNKNGSKLLKILEKTPKKIIRKNRNTCIKFICIVEPKNTINT